MTSASLTMALLANEKDWPKDRHCKACEGPASLTWKLNGEVLPNRFMKVSGPALHQNQHGIYCESCVHKAGLIGNAKKALGHYEVH